MVVTFTSTRTSRNNWMARKRTCSLKLLILNKILCRILLTNHLLIIFDQLLILICWSCDSNLSRLDLLGRLIFFILGFSSHEVIGNRLCYAWILRAKHLVKKGFSCIVHAWIDGSLNCDPFTAWLKIEHIVQCSDLLRAKRRNYCFLFFIKQLNVQ